MGETPKTTVTTTNRIIFILRETTENNGVRIVKTRSNAGVPVVIKVKYTVEDGWVRVRTVKPYVGVR